MAAEQVPGERWRESEVQFRLLEWDRGPEFWGAAVPFEGDPASARRCWFCVRAVRRRDGKPRRIEEHSITVELPGIDDGDVEIDKEEGWCHYNFAFEARPGLQLLVVRSDGRVVVERVVCFTSADEEEPTWSSKGPERGLTPKELALAHFAQGQRKKSWGDLQKFRRWAAEGEWSKFGPAHSHYDWWMFPIPTRASKPEFAVGTGEVQELKGDERFMRHYREGVQLMLRSWGWELACGAWCEHRHPEQGWRNWSVRLAKVALSLATFHEMLLFNQVRDFLRALLVEEAAGQPHLTRESGHTEFGGKIEVERQFGIDPCEILLL